MPGVMSQIGTESNGEIVFPRVREIGEKFLRHHFIASSSSHFFEKKNEFDQYLFTPKVKTANV